MRSLWLPRLMDRRPWEQWVEKKDGARETARQRAAELLKTHQADPLDPALAAELKKIIAAQEDSKS
jgi:trimethylamine:corrinoid methyltransferase-like protein